ncbi:hypothetical protein MIR68_004335 [Amoeboaphelidium protococcarum]|nr:hypothetical protein MIR68_004335 [Amoeboaphelidium protococcarum]
MRPQRVRKRVSYNYDTYPQLSDGDEDNKSLEINSNPSDDEEFQITSDHEQQEAVDAILEEDLPDHQSSTNEDHSVASEQDVADQDSDIVQDSDSEISIAEEQNPPQVQQLSSEQQLMVDQMALQSLVTLYENYTNSLQLKLPRKGPKVAVNVQEFEKILTVKPSHGTDNAQLNIQDEVNSNDKVKKGRPKKNKSRKSTASQTGAMYKCPLPGCDKEFKVLPSLKYHFDTFYHSLEALLIHGKQQQQIVVDSVDCEQMMDHLQRASTTVELKDVPYYWQGFDVLQYANIKFKNAEQVTLDEYKRTTKTRKRYRGRSSYNSGQITWRMDSINQEEPTAAVVIYPQKDVISLSEEQRSLYALQKFPLEIFRVSNDDKEVQLLSFPEDCELLTFNDNKCTIINNGGLILAMEIFQIQVSDTSCTFIACGGSLSIIDQPIVGVQKGGPSVIRVWRLNGAGQVCCILSLVTDHGSVLCLKFFSNLLWVSFEDGSLAAYNLIQVLSFQAEESVKMESVFHYQSVDSQFTTIQCIDGDTLVAGDSCGRIWLFNQSENGGFLSVVLSALIHECSITSLSVVRESAQEQQDVKIVSCGYDGRILITSICDMSHSLVALRSRGFLPQVQWLPQCDSLMYAQNDCTLKLMNFAASNATNSENDHFRSGKVTQHQSQVHSFDVTSIEGGEPFVVYASADGRVGFSKFTNVLKSWNVHSRDRVPSFMQNVYHLVPMMSDPQLPSSGILFIEGDCSRRSIDMKNTAVRPEYVPQECQVSQVRFCTVGNETLIVSSIRSGLIRIDTLL